MTTETTKKGLLLRAQEDERVKAYANSVRTPESQQEIAALRKKMAL